MRLYDIIQQHVGTKLDSMYRGLITNFAKALKEAECFELGPQVVTACSNVAASKPSSIIAASPMLRLPYPAIWLEWYSDRGDYLRHNEKLIPQRMGCLLCSDGPVSNRGYAYWAWYHEGESLTIAPFGLAFDWEPGRAAGVAAELLTRLKLPRHLLQTMTDRFGGVVEAQAILVNTEQWYDKATNEAERKAFMALEKRAVIVPNHHAMKFIEAFNLLDPKNPQMNEFTDDVCGELPFVEAFIIMLNSRHILERNNENLGKLNKARSKQRKPALREFTITRLRLTRTTENRLRAGGMDRTAARAHLCRGHFKVRSSGVYWWSSHLRSGKGGTVQRNTYKAD